MQFPSFLTVPFIEPLLSVDFHEFSYSLLPAEPIHRVATMKTISRLA